MAIALPYHVTLAQHVPAGALSCQLQSADNSFTSVNEVTGGPAILGAACVRFETTLTGSVAFQRQPAFGLLEGSQQAGPWVPLEPHAQRSHRSSSKRVADGPVPHPTPSKQRRTAPQLASPAVHPVRCSAPKARRPAMCHTHTPQWTAVSPVHNVLAPADCSSASCPAATTSTVAPQQPAQAQQYSQLRAWSASPCHLALLPYCHPSPSHAPHHNPTQAHPHLAACCVPQYPCAPALPHPEQHYPPETSSLSHHSHLRLTPAQVSTHTSTATATAWPEAGATCECQPSFWDPSPAPQPQQQLWEPSPSGSSCSAASSWLPTTAPASCLQPTQPQQPQYQLQYRQQQPHPQYLQQHQPQHQPMRPQSEHTAILCRLTTAAMLQPQHLPQTVTCQPHSLLPVPTAAATQLPPLPPSVPWYSDSNSPVALLEANDFMATIPLPGAVEYLRVTSGSAMHRLGVLCSVSAASICLAQSYYLRLRHCMPLLQSALRLLSSLPGASSASSGVRRAPAPASPARSQAEAVITGVKFTCVALAAKMLEARSGQQKQLRGLLAHLTSSAVASTDTVAIEVRVLQHLDWRLGPYFLPPACDCDAGDHWH